jgi:hypothetical protein
MSSGAVSGGSGAPLMSESGKLLLPLHEDPAITFSESTRNYVDKDLRYRRTPQEKTAYKQELDKIIEEKKRLKFNERFNGSGPGGSFRNVSVTSSLTSQHLHLSPLLSLFSKTAWIHTQSHGVDRDRVSECVCVCKSVAKLSINQLQFGREFTRHRSHTHKIVFFSH